jgi:hypothetical protein
MSTDNLKRLKVTSVLSALALAASLLVSAPATANGCNLVGSGTAQAPYQIATKADFVAIPSCDGTGKHFALTNNVHLAAVSPDPPTHSPFELAGSLDGQGFRIFGFRVDERGASADADRDNVGLFKKLLPGSSVTNLTISAADIRGGDFVGGLAGSAVDASVERVRLEFVSVEGVYDVGGLLGSAEQTVISKILTKSTVEVVGYARMGGLVGHFTAGSLDSVTELYADTYLLQQNGFPVFEEGIGGIFGQLSTVKSFTLSEVGSRSSIVALNSSQFGMPAGLIGYHLVDHADPAQTAKLAFHKVGAVSVVQHDSQITPFGLLFGVSASDTFGEPKSVEVTESFAHAINLDSAPESLALEPVITGTHVNGAFVSETFDDYFFTSLGAEEAEENYFGVSTVGLPNGVTEVIDQFGMTRFSFWKAQGFDILEPADNQQIIAGTTASWYHAAHFAGEDDMVYPVTSFPVYVWMAELEVYGALAVPSGDPKSFSPGDDVSNDVRRGSFVNVTQTERVYFDGFFESRDSDSYDDNSLSYVSPGVSCTDGFQRISADAYVNGYFVPHSPNLDSSLRCEVAGSEVRLQTEQNPYAGFPLGFEFELGGQRYSHLVPTTNGQLKVVEQGGAPFNRNIFSAMAVTPPAILVPLGVDLVFDSSLSSFWAGHATIEGKNAAVFTWENFSIFPTDTTRPNGEFATFQAVLIEGASGPVEVWFNYGGVRIAPGQRSGVNLPNLTFDFNEGVVPGTNRVNFGTAVDLTGGCIAADFDNFQPVSIIESADITDANLRAFFDDGDGDVRTYTEVFLEAVSGQSNQVALFKDSGCSDPLVIETRQNVARDGRFVSHIQLYSGGTGVTIGYGAVPVSINEPLVLVDLFQNQPMSQFVNGGSNQLIEISIGTEVPGRIVLELPFTVASATGGSFAGPAVTSGPVSGRVGEVVTLRGERLGSITAVSVEGVVAQLISVSDSSFSFRVPVGVSLGLRSVSVNSSFGNVTFQGALRVLAGSAAAGGAGGVGSGAGEATASIRRLSEGEAKVWVRDVVGEGKVQILLNGRELGWVRAIDATDPKLRVPSSGPMAGRAYFVRTAQLAPGKNVLEVLVDGERVRRVVYSR